MLMRVGSGNRAAYNGIIGALDRIRTDHVGNSKALNDRVVKAIGLQYGTTGKAKYTQI
jgi:hypothetical protein